MRGFTLVEILLAMAVSILLMTLLVGAVQQVSRVSHHASASSSAFDEARLAFAEMQNWLGQATLSPYWDVSYNSNGDPADYFRKSDLHFVSGRAGELLPDRQTAGSAVFFQAPLGFDPSGAVRDSALNAAGFFIEYRDANADAPLANTESLPPRWRFQLRAFRQPSSSLEVFATNGMSPRQWFHAPLSLTTPPVITLADNILFLVVRARTLDGPVETSYFDYDSRSWNGEGIQPPTSHQLPALLDLLVVACDEATAGRLGGDGSMPVFPAEFFNNPANFEEDASEFELWLAQEYPGGVFRAFRATVPIRAAKWSIDRTVQP